MPHIRIAPSMLTLAAVLLGACTLPVEPRPAASPAQIEEASVVAPPEAEPFANLETTTYSSEAFGIEFDYPASWYLEDTTEAISLTSFDPGHPPHKLEWTVTTTSVHFAPARFDLQPGAFESGVQAARQDALASQLEITSEEQFTIAGEPAVRLSLVSGSGGIIQRVLTYVAGRGFEIDMQGSLALGQAVLDSIRTYSPPAPAVLPPPEASATAPPPSVEGGEVRVITLADNGGMIEMNVDDRLALDLGGGYEWSASSSDGYVLSEDQGVWRAAAPGSATLTATGNPACYYSTPQCLMPSILFAVEVNVR